MHEPKVISYKIAQNNTNYKIRVDDKNKVNTFNVGDVQKLHTCCSDPFQMLMKIKR